MNHHQITNVELKLSVVKVNFGLVSKIRFSEMLGDLFVMLNYSFNHIICLLVHIQNRREISLVHSKSRNFCMHNLKWRHLSCG